MKTNLKEQVAAKVAALGPAVAEKVVTTLVTVELERRADLVQAGLLKADDLRVKRKKLEAPDDVRFQEKDGQMEEVKSFSKGRVDERRKLDAEVARVEGLIETALTVEDPQKQEQAYEGLEKACKGDGGGNKG